MKNNHKMWQALGLAASLALGISGCGGSDSGVNEDTHPDLGEARSVNELLLSVSDIKTQGGKTEVVVLATNEDDESVVGLQNMQMNHYVLYPQGYASSGDSAKWASVGRFDSYKDNGDGTYSFVRDQVAMEDGITQRFNIISAKGVLANGYTKVPHEEVSLDFSSSGGQAAYTKSIVASQTCENCHNPAEPIARRHQQYFELDTCASCHSETNLGGKRASFQHLVHAVHNSGNRFTDSQGNDYSGLAAQKLLQNNCETCHQADDELPEWNNWSRVPTKETCSACHNAGYQDDGSIVHISHLAQQRDNASCSACHAADAVEQIHVSEHRAIKQVGDALSSKLSLSSTQDGSVNATIELLDEQGYSIDANTVLASLDLLEVIGQVNPQAPVLNADTQPLISVGGDAIAQYITDHGSIEVQLQQLLADDFAMDTALVAVAMRVCATQGKLVVCGQHNAYVSLDSSASLVANPGVSLKPRHQDSVDTAACIGCHGDSFQIHSSQAASAEHAGFVLGQSMQVGDCAVCHSAHGADSAQKGMGAIELTLHQVHQDQAIISDCSQCHNDFNTDAFATKVPLATGAEGYSSPWAATCGSCHSFEAQMKGSSGTVAEHMQSYGNAVINQPFAVGHSQESCGMCHVPTLADHGARKR